MPTSNPTSLINSISELIEEDLTPGIRDSEPMLDPFFKHLYTTNMGVSRDGVGRDWKVIHTLIEGVSGAFKWVTAGGNQPNQFSGTAHFVNPGTPEEFQGLDESVNPGYIQKIITLVKGMGNLFVPHEFLRADKLDASIANAISQIIRGAAKNIALAEIQSFYAASSNQEIATIGAVTNSSDVATVEVQGQAVRGIYTGLHVDIWDSTGTTQRNPGVLCVVDGVRYVPESTDSGYGTMKIRRKDGGTISDLSFAANDLVVRRDSKGVGPLGPAQWLINTGTIYGINVATYEQFKSIVDTSVSSVLTEKILNKYFGRFFKSYGMEHMPDCILTSQGVTDAHVENSDGLSRFARNGQAFTIADGYDMGDVPFKYNGRQMDWKTSGFMPSTSDFSAASQTGGQLWGLKTRDQNIVKYLPPSLPGAKYDSQFGSEVEFVFPLGGPNGIFKPYHSTSGHTTTYQEAPLYHWCAIAPEFIPGVRLGGLTETL